MGILKILLNIHYAVKMMEIISTLFLIKIFNQEDMVEISDFKHLYMECWVFFFVFIRLPFLTTLAK